MAQTLQADHVGGICEQMTVMREERVDLTETRRADARRMLDLHSPSPAGTAPSHRAFSRRSRHTLAWLGLLGAVFLGTFADAAWLRARRAPARIQNAELVDQLGLTDLCLFADARYTRHLSQADLHSAFQDYPGAFEHFPSGSFVSPPRSLTTHHANLDRTTTLPD